jgi:hypothetical protein
MAKVFTPATIAEIRRRASAGAGARAIAIDLGLNEASLRVKCCEYSISLRTRRPTEGVRSAIKLGHRATSPDLGAGGFEQGGDALLFVPLGRRTKLQLRKCADAKNVTLERLAAKLLTLVAQEGLCKAVLDEEN